MLKNNHMSLVMHGYVITHVMPEKSCKMRGTL